MSGIMRAPVPGASFAIPYSGTPKPGDCVLVSNNGEVSIVARYFLGIWSIANYITDFSAGNNVISFNSNMSTHDSRAAFIPGPNHV